MDYDALYAAVTHQESRGNPNAVSPVGALGLMQVMPATAMDPGYGMPSIFEVAKQFGFQPGDRSAATARSLLLDPEVNAAFGKMYLDRMIRNYGGDVRRALVAYNWGPGNANDWDGSLGSLPDETRNYVQKISADYVRRVGGGDFPEDVADVGSSLRPQARPEDGVVSTRGDVLGVPALGGVREERRRAAVEAAPEAAARGAARNAGISTVGGGRASVVPKGPPRGGIMDLIGGR